MANWYYARDSEQQGPVTLDEMRDVVARRVIGPSDLVWSEGMAEWVELRTVPALSTPAQTNTPAPQANPLEASPAMNEGTGAPATQAHAAFAMKPKAMTASSVALTPPPVIVPPLAGPMPVLPVGVPPPAGWMPPGQGYPPPAYGAPGYGQPFGQPAGFAQQPVYGQQTFQPAPSKGTPVWVWFVVGGGVLLVLFVIGTAIMATSKARQAAQRVQAAQAQRQAQLAAQQRANNNPFGTTVTAPGSRFNGSSTYLSGIVQADEGWQPVREMESGQRITFSTAIGIWNTQPRSFNSSSNRRPAVALDSRWPANALIGRIGTQQFLVNSGVSVDVGQDGLLELRINEADGGLTDNSGSKSVTMRLTKE